MQSYVVVRNLRPNPRSFNDHLGGIRTLDGFGLRDTEKILLDEKDLDRQVRFYNGMGKSGEVQVAFSENIVIPPDRLSKMKVTSFAAVEDDTAKRLEFVRAEQKRNGELERSNQARQIRVKAEAQIAANVANASAMPLKDEKKLKGKEPAREPIIGGDDKGMDLTAETLKKMNKPDLIEIGVKMGIKFRPGASAGGMIKAILLRAGQ